MNISQNMKYFNTVIFTLLSAIGLTQEESFEFAEGMCTYIGSYDSEKYSELELQNTFDHLFFSPYISAPSTAWDLDEVQTLSVETLVTECEMRLQQLNSIAIVDSKFWENVRQNRIREITETCKLKALTILAYENPDTLMSFETTDSLSTYFRNALIIGGDQLVDAWIKLNEIQKAKNSAPQNIQRKFNGQYNSPLKMDYAQLSIIQFGWWNHANHVIYHDPQEGYFSQFEKLFISIETTCDGP